ncbi:uncharacterized protein B0T23DRAFT_408954 [Neurospora hispaniola]|uniref:Uncharacterized protein n=1 Tax=Neurospora hispaniola TaxID=588809 RepID=A0AAJ0HY27_9PEZI|nr:hypothetical protein B0T23DRAFT_408954 [Neurospora hispaniola]
MFLAYCEAYRSLTTDFLAKPSGIMLFILPPGGGTIDNSARREVSHKYSARPNISYSTLVRDKKDETNQQVR